ncbi:alpha,alpha-trehalose-phosphate synthase [UDP-forming] [Variibacter gotjawalensis]|uniref:Alpha,alpha-trehalose-phosphate synthase [UDP-forming] n=1 Tax=Variibacter gotjawalensis TaxID=1333996 RepID=A0A0S3PUU7_9BRAD|nr:trehalose 6-phosphate synthase [Variibacter gotjawalensis]BAT59636.1 alpha,alpha-trehalose-phosphate synthase [UDP-forming] [Variibacter gotjawalensis]
MTVVVVSNRVVSPKPNAPIEGGLAGALLPAVRDAGAIWVGASDRLSSGKDPLIEIEPLGEGAIARVDMPAEFYERYYEGYSNAVLWPAFHSRTDLIRSSQTDYTAYREVNAFMARSLLRFTHSGSAYWVHDYHFLLLADELRKLGITRPIGFFLHTPFPSRNIMLSVPQHDELVRAMLSYDLIGFQTEDDLTHFADYLKRELDLEGKDDTYVFEGRPVHLQAFPIGINVQDFAERATKASAQPEITRLRASIQGRKLAIGVDRLDYSKGLPNRIRAVDRMFEIAPEMRGSMHLLQIAVPSRTHIPAYQELKQEISQLVGDVNGRVGDVDWTPIRYLNRSYSQAALAGFYRVADVGLVTPLNDGMNLVAKEYVAAQNPLDPGVLVLSEFAGAARQLDSAVLVNPHDIEAVARGLIQALTMTIAERRERWNAMMAKMKDFALDAWFNDYVAVLMDCRKPARVVVTKPLAPGSIPIDRAAV